MSSIPEQNEVISKCLVDARLSAQPLADFPVRLPDTLEQAYRIQAASINRWPDEIAGWKVAKMSEDDQARLSAERLVGPVFRSSVRLIEAGASTVIPVYAGGFAAVEAEIVFELGDTISPSGRAFSDEELVAMVAAAYCGTEIATSPMAEVNKRGPTSVVSDLGINGGVLVGPVIPDWTGRQAGDLNVIVTVDDVQVGNKPVDALTGSPLQALRCLIDNLAGRGIELPAGTLVSTGAITGVHDVAISSTSRVDFGSFGWFDLTFEPITPIDAA